MIKMQYQISLQTRFSRTNNETTERDPTPEEYDEFMKKEERYKQFIYELLDIAIFVDENNNIPSSTAQGDDEDDEDKYDNTKVGDIQYRNGGIIEFKMSDRELIDFSGNEDITDYIYDFPYDDTIYEGITAIYPTNATKHYEYPDYPDELGVIDCSEEDDVTVTKLP
jgi:hypothetical protein